jgi:uncharacterized peroxidase-related enzyme
MAKFNVYGIDNCPEGSRDDMQSVQDNYGFLPNIYGVFAESPSVIKAYLALTNLLNAGSFSPAEQQLMLLTVSAVNGCEYCVAAHTMVGKMAQLEDTVIEAIRTGIPIPDHRMAALHHFTKLVVEKRGWLDDSEIDAFMAAGFTKAQVFEVALANSIKTLSNYINHMADTPLDEAMQAFAWDAPESRVA